MATFGQRVREARIRRGWTQKELALACGLTQSAIGNYESEQRTEPTSAALIKLAHALKVTPEWLRQGPGPATRGGPDRLRKSSSRGSCQPASTAIWPFHGVSFDEFTALSAVEKRMLDSMVETFVRSRLAQR